MKNQIELLLVFITSIAMFSCNNKQTETINTTEELLSGYFETVGGYENIKAIETKIIENIDVGEIIRIAMLVIAPARRQASRFIVAEAANRLFCSAFFSSLQVRFLIAEAANRLSRGAFFS